MHLHIYVLLHTRMLHVNMAGDFRDTARLLGTPLLEDWSRLMQGWSRYMKFVEA
jgi:hypothetical protein